MAHLPNLIKDLALILASAGLVILIFKKLKQPLVLGYIIAGFLVGPHFKLFPTISDTESIKIWAEIGVIFLLFSLGLEFSFKKLLKVGGASSITAIVEITTMFAVGYFTGMLLGWSSMNRIFLGGILSISSTTIIIRAFEELKLKTQKFAILVFGVLIVEDLVAIILLVLLSTLSLSKQFEGVEIISSLLKLGFFLMIWFLGGIFLIPTFLKRARKLMNDETMLIVSLALCLLMVLLAIEAGFSAALGAFIMGSILAETTYAERIEHLIKSVKDLFGAIFFVSVGMLIEPAMLKLYAIPIVIITVVTILGKLLSTSAGALLSGQGLKNSLRAGMSLSQIGEFSFIIATLGLTLGVTDDFLYPVAVAVSAITTFTTPYLIRSSDSVYQWLEKTLPEKWIKQIDRYSSGAQKMKSSREWKKTFQSYALTIITNSVILIALLLVAIKFFTPFIRSKVDNDILSSAITAIAALAVMAPFLWGLSGKKLMTEREYYTWRGLNLTRGPLIFLELLRIVLAVLFTWFLLYQLFSPGAELTIAMIVVLTGAVIFSSYLSRFYLNIEQHFVDNLNARKLEKPLRPVAEMLPWDTHISELQVSAESPLAGKSLLELKLREEFGINVARIERGKIIINLPKKEDKLFPGDMISVIGTDEELHKFGRALNPAEEIFADMHTDHEVTLQQFIVGPDSPLIGNTIREVGIHGKIFGLVIGVERDGQRIVNPESTFKFEEGDIVWIAGEENLKELLG